MALDKKIIKRAKKNFSIIVLPEAENCERVLNAAKLASKKNIAKIILIGNEDLKQHEDGNIKVIDTKTYENRELLIKMLVDKRKDKGMTLEDAENLINDPIYFGTMLVECGFADGMVAGAITSTGDVFRPALQIIKARKGIKNVSSAMIMIGQNIPNKEKTLIIADCGLIIKPDAEQLAEIAIGAAKLCKDVVEATPKLAFISYTTHSKNETEDTSLIKEAMNILKERKVDFEFDGELQADAALLKEVASVKTPDSTVAGSANVLIFTNISTGNTVYKLMQIAGKMKVIGPVSLGLNKQVNDVSRGATVDEILMSIAYTASTKSKK